MVETVLKIILCHMFGDYVFQSDFIAKTKGSSWYHLLIHCFLYIAPFYICFGYDYRLILLLASHIVIDPLKARWNKIDYFTDQVLHYVIAAILYLRWI